MILIGQYDSPFVRRVAIALRLYGIAFEHRPWSTFGDADKIAPYNPLRRVPTLVLDGGEVLIESTAILDYLDETVGPDKAMIARSGAERRKQLRICALATGLGDKAVSLIYERVLRKEQLETVGRALPGADLRRARGAGEGARRGDDAVLVRRAHRPCRHRGRLRAALYRRGASGAVVGGALSGADGARRALRGAAAVPGDRAAAGSAEGVRCYILLPLWERVARSAGVGVRAASAP